MIDDPFILLGLSKDSDFEEVKKRYRELAKIYHPDSLNSLSSQDKMALLNASYDIIEKSFINGEIHNEELSTHSEYNSFASKNKYEKELEKMEILFSLMSPLFSEKLVELSTIISFIFYSGGFMPTILKNLKKSIEDFINFKESDPMITKEIHLPVKKFLKHFLFFANSPIKFGNEAKISERLAFLQYLKGYNALYKSLELQFIFYKIRIIKIKHFEKVKQQLSIAIPIFENVIRKYPKTFWAMEAEKRLIFIPTIMGLKDIPFPVYLVH